MLRFFKFQKLATESSAINIYRNFYSFSFVIPKFRVKCILSSIPSALQQEKGKQYFSVFQNSILNKFQLSPSSVCNKVRLLRHHNSQLTLKDRVSRNYCYRFAESSDGIPLPINTVEENQIPPQIEFDAKVESSTDMTLRVLNVAEKNDAAKRIAGLLSEGRAQTRNTFSKFNKSYEFQYNWRGTTCDMKFTSVSGHLLGFEFNEQYRKWYSCDPVELFDAPVVKLCPENFKDIQKTLEMMAPQCSILVIWTDCDREGEGIGFEIINVCKAKNPRLQVYRAKFSEITPTAISRAWRGLGQPNKRLSDAVDVRSELDLRIGAAFTRFQTLRLCKRFPSVLTDRLISYGSCQFPTLGFVVERYKSIQDFIMEDFWKIDVSHTVGNCSVDFNWARVRLFNKLAVQILYEKCLDNPIAKVIKVNSKPKNKWRPVALDTVEFEKLASRKLRINAKEAMKIAEKLYTQGIISYPRTETNIFPQGLDLRPLVDAQTASRDWGDFASRLLQSGTNPRNGKNTDQAHPPIHPTKFVTLAGNEGRVYELIVRHFLACCSKDAVGRETTVEIEIAEERFVGHGLRILERNYLEVYPYDKWSDKELPSFTDGQRFRPTELKMTEGQTSPPNLLTEADLISLMEKHGIGTDATHAEHIETIKQRMYVGVQGDGKFVPGQLGMGLVEGYDAMGFQMSKPHLRAELEADLKGICEGRKDPQAVLREQVQKYKQVFIVTKDLVDRLDAAVGRFLNQDLANAPPANGPAPRHPGAGGGGYNRRGGGGGPDDDDDDGGGPPPPPVNPAPRHPGTGGGGYNRRGGGGGRNDDDDDGAGGLPPPSGGAAAWGGGGGSSSRARHISEDENTSRFPECRCGIPAISLTVKKEGANKGRLFFSCSKGFNSADKCNFFQWDDEGIGKARQQAARTPARGQPSGRGNFRSAFNDYSSNRGNARGGGIGPKRTTGPRKCSICKEVGHTKRNCPIGVAQMMDDDESYYN